jgi:hypothetical protein
MKDELSDLLNTWQPPIPEPPDFRRGVWSKIETLPLPRGWLTVLLAAIARPRTAVRLLAVAAIVGGLAGGYLSRDLQEDAYLRSVNPYAMAK